MVLISVGQLYPVSHQQTKGYTVALRVPFKQILYTEKSVIYFCNDHPR